MKTKKIAYLVEKRDGSTKLVLISVVDKPGEVERVEKQISERSDVYRVSELATYDNYCFGTDGI